MQTNNTYTLLVANMSTECLGNCGIIFYRTDLLGIRCTLCAVTPSFTVFAITIFMNVNASAAFSFPRIKLLGI